MGLVERLMNIFVVRGEKVSEVNRADAAKVKIGKDGLDLIFKKGRYTYEIHHYHVFLLKKVPKNMNVHTLFVKKFKGIAFSLLYDFEEEKIYLVTIGVKREIIESIFEGIAGLEFEHMPEPLDEEVDHKTLWRYVAFPLPEEVVEGDSAELARSISLQSKKYYKPDVFADLYRALRGDHAKMLISFVPASEAELESERKFYEEVLRTGGGGSKKMDVSKPVLLSNVLSSMLTTRPVDVTRGSIIVEDTRRAPTTYVSTARTIDPHRVHIAKTIIAMCANAKLTNDAIFRVAVIGYGEDSHILEMHFASKFPCLKEPVEMREELTFGIPQKEGDVMSGLFASNFIYLPEDYRRRKERVKEFKNRMEK
jgi:hypothetical protein